MPMPKAAAFETDTQNRGPVDRSGFDDPSRLISALLAFKGADFQIVQRMGRAPN